MQVSDIVRPKEIVDEEKLIRHLDLGIKYMKENNLLSDKQFLKEAADMVEVDGKWLVDYDSEGASGRRTPQQAARDVQVFDNRRDANRAVQQFNRTGRRTITATAAEAPGKWRTVGGNRGARIHDLKLQLQGRLARALRFGTRLLGIVGITAGHLETYQNYQIELYLDYRHGFMDEETYERATRAQTAAFLPHLAAQFVAAMSTTRIVTRVITVIRAGAMALGAPAGGPIGMALGFLVGQAVGWGVAWFLQQRWVAEALIQFFYFTPLGDILGGATEAGLDAASGAYGSDVQQALGLNRRGSETAAAISAPSGSNGQSGSSGSQGWDAIDQALGTN